MVPGVLIAAEDSAPRRMPAKGVLLDSVAGVSAVVEEIRATPLPPGVVIMLKSRDDAGISSSSPLPYGDIEFDGASSGVSGRRRPLPPNTSTCPGLVSVGGRLVSAANLTTD